MLRRLTAIRPLRNIYGNSNYPFTDQKGNKQQYKPKHRSFVSQRQLQKLMLIRIYTLTKDSLGNESKWGFGSKSKFFDKILKQSLQKRKTFKKDKIKQEDRKKEMEDTLDLLKKVLSPDTSADKLKNGILYFNRAVIVAFLLYLLWSSENKSSKTPEGQSIKRIVNQKQMINLLTTGKFNQQIIILREMIFSDATNKKLYQTVCLAKEISKSDVPVGCIIINLPQFLKKVEQINFPYKVNFHYSAQDHSYPSINFDFGKLLFFGIIAYIIYKVRAGMKGGAGGGIGQMFNMKKFQPIKPQNIQTLFKDVAGMHEAKTEITQFVDFLKSPDKYIEMGAKVPKGALLTGPPGTGKTLLARACAGQAGVPFFYVSGSEFVQKYVGLGANRVRSLFEAAAKVAPSIIFIDQIDAIGKKRNSGPFSNEQKENTLNQLLVNMDGFDTKNKIIVMAATNLKDTLDPALLRPGRFDRAIQINLPNFQERCQILKVHLLKVKFSEQYTIDELAKRISVLTPGFSGAELANICNEAAILAARQNKQFIELREFEKATERVMAGLEKRNLFSDEEKQCLAYYQCGKAVVSWFTEGADPIIKISIAPFSKQNKGYSHEIKDQMPLKTQSELLNRAICFLAGRTAQNHFKGYSTSNGDSQMKKAKRIITYMVSKLGMSPIIGRIGFPDTEYMRKPFSDHTEDKIDKEIERIFLQCQEKAKTLVLEKTELIQQLKQLIIEKETLTHNTLKQILGDRPFKDNQNYQKYLKDATQNREKQQQEVTMTPPSPQ